LQAVVYYIAPPWHTEPVSRKIDAGNGQVSPEVEEEEEVKEEA